MSFAARLLAKTAAAGFLSRLLAPAVDQALPPAEAPAATPEKPKEADPLADAEGVIQVPHHSALSPSQLDHLLHRIFYNPKHKELAEEVRQLTNAQAARRPYVVG